MLTEAYIAGLFDGEGCIQAQMTKGGIGLVAWIHNTYRPVLEEVAETLGYGKVTRPLWTASSTKPGQKFRVCAADEVQDFLVTLLPFLRIKHAEAVAAIELSTIKLATYTPQSLARACELVELLHALKRSTEQLAAVED